MPLSGSACVLLLQMLALLLLVHGAAAQLVPPEGAFRVNRHGRFRQEDPAVAVDAAGNAMVVWDSRRRGERGGVRCSITSRPPWRPIPAVASR
jgi:hypothetical protein